MSYEPGSTSNPAPVRRGYTEIEAELRRQNAKLAAITIWLEENQPDVFRRGL